ncbi:MAG: hypothetical protein KAW17_08940 [Candidatus Eisenbacteria sp.]|nr:hypothetical protein [Candidatus Eisenbacteria bacterium]
MSRFRLFLSLMAVAILIPSIVAADQPGPFRADVSALGMGNTGVAVPGRGCLWSYNPALLSTFSFDLSVPNVDLGANGKTLEFFDFLEDHQETFEKWEDTSWDQDDTKRDALLEDAEEFYGKRLGFRTAPLVGFATRNFGAALYADTRATVIMRRPALEFAPKTPDFAPPVYGRFHTDVVAQIGTAGMAFDPLAIGITLRYINRRAKSLRIDPADLDEVVSTMSEEPESYHGWAVDLAAYYPTGFWNIALGASFRNILGKIQTPGPDAEHPEENKESDNFYRNLVVGASWQPMPRLLLTADIEDFLNQVDNLEFGDQIHVGAELDMVLLKFRTGIFRGAVTYGAGLNLLFFKIDVATFLPAEESAILTEDEQRVYIGQVKVGW